MASRGVKELPTGVCRLSCFRSQSVARNVRVPPQVLIPSTSSHIHSYEPASVLPPRLCNLRRPMSTAASSNPPKKKARKEVNITFIDRDGDEHTVKAKVGDSLLEVAKEYDIDLEGACEGTLSCSTCHLIVDTEWYSKIPDPLTEEEQDMLDLAFGLSDTSRLGCQILVSEGLEGIKLSVPAATKDARNQ